MQGMDEGKFIILLVKFVYYVIIHNFLNMWDMKNR